MPLTIVFRALLLWLAIIPLAIGNGLLRDLWLAPLLGSTVARLISGVSLCLLILGWCWLTVHWLGRLRAMSYIIIGLVWLVLTVAFEFSFGRLVARHTWDVLLRPYRFVNGDLWPVVLIATLLAPWLAARIRGIV